MSTPSATHPGAHAEHRPHLTVRMMIIIYFSLLGLMFLTYFAAKIDMGRANFLIAMTIAVAKMTLIILYFMHVRYSEKLTWVASAGMFLWLLIMVGGMLNDYFTRDYLNVPGK